MKKIFTLITILLFPFFANASTVASDVSGTDFYGLNMWYPFVQPFQIDSQKEINEIVLKFGNAQAEINTCISASSNFNPSNCINGNIAYRNVYQFEPAEFIIDLQTNNQNYILDAGQYYLFVWTTQDWNQELFYNAGTFTLYYKINDITEDPEPPVSNDKTEFNNIFWSNLTKIFSIPLGIAFLYLISMRYLIRI